MRQGLKRLIQCSRVVLTLNVVDDIIACVCVFVCVCVCGSVGNDNEPFSPS